METAIVAGPNVKIISLGTTLFIAFTAGDQLALVLLGIERRPTALTFDRESSPRISHALNAPTM